MKLGRFYVSQCFFNKLTDDEGVNLFDRMVVLEAHKDYRYWRTEYLAYHPDFKEVQEGYEVPLYRAIFNDVSSTPYWEKADDKR